MTERISYDDLAAFFSSQYGSTCETKSRIDRYYQDREVNYLECSTAIEGLSTFTMTLPEDGINSFADLNCISRTPAAVTCYSIRGNEYYPDEMGFAIALKKDDAGSLSAIGGLIYADSTNLIFGRARKLLDFLSSVDFGWYWAGTNGVWYTREGGDWNSL